MHAITKKLSKEKISKKCPSLLKINERKEKEINVYIVEDNDMLNELIKIFINSYREMNLLGSAFNGKEAVDEIKRMDIAPDVVLMDICMPKMNGIEATREILTFNPLIKVIILTASVTKQNIADAFTAGAIGYLEKDGELNIIIREAINRAFREKENLIFLPYKLADYLLE